jgi:hypothetical protein
MTDRTVVISALILIKLDDEAGNARRPVLSSARMIGSRPRTTGILMGYVPRHENPTSTVCT